MFDVGEQPQLRALDAPWSHLCPIWCWHRTFQSSEALWDRGQLQPGMLWVQRWELLCTVNSGLISELSQIRVFKPRMHPSSIPRASPTPLELVVKTEGILDYLKPYRNLWWALELWSRLYLRLFKEQQLKQFMDPFCPVQPLRSCIKHHPAKPELFTPVQFSPLATALRWCSCFGEAAGFLVPRSYCTSSWNKTTWMHFSLHPSYLGWKAAPTGLCQGCFGRNFN